MNKKQFRDLHREVIACAAGRGDCFVYMDEHWNVRISGDEPKPGTKEEDWFCGKFGVDVKLTDLIHAIVVDQLGEIRRAKNSGRN